MSPALFLAFRFTMTTDPQKDFTSEDAALATLSATERVAWAVERFGDGLVMSTSFGLQSAVMLHLVTEVNRDIPIIFVDTGYLFKETYAYAETLRECLGTEPKVYSARLSSAYQEARFGKLWEQGDEGMNRYLEMNKVEPMSRALGELGATAWLAGLRREQSEERAGRGFIECRNDVAKVYPILDWSSQRTYRYLRENDLPGHPLADEPYDSLGDWHSTRKLESGVGAEDARHGGKRECGLHLDLPQGHVFDI